MVSMGGVYMSQITEAELKKKIQKGEIEKVYCFYGPERYLLEGYVSMLSKRVVSGSEFFNCKRLEGEKLTVEQLEAETEVLPMMSKYRFVSVMDWELDKLGKKQMDDLFSMIDNLPETTVLLFWFRNIEVNLKKMSKYKNTIQHISKIGTVVEFSYKTPSDLVKILVKRAAKNGCELSQKTARLLIDRCGVSLQRLLLELDKLTAIAANNIILPEHVEQLVVPILDSSVFDLARAILQNRTGKVFLLLDELYVQRQEEISILSAIYTAFLDIYRVKCAQICGKDETVILEAFPYKGKEFRVRNATRDCARFSMEQIRWCIHCLMNADYRLKSSRVENRIILETAIGEMMLPSSKGERR